MTYRPRVYTASKLHHHALWRELHVDPAWAHVEFTARWPSLAHLEAERKADLTASDYRNFWNIDKQDVMRSDFVLLYAGEPIPGGNPGRFDGKDNLTLRGGLVEAGMAIAFNKTVVTVGVGTNHTWTHGAAVVRLPNLSEARNFFFRYSTGEA